MDNVELVLLALEDITVRKKAEDDMKKLNDALEKKNKELEEVMNITSHDMRSPLISVIGFSKKLGKDLQDISSLIESNKASVEIKEMLSPLISDIAESTEYICSSALNMEALLAGLSKVLRIGYVALTKEQLDMNILISDVKNVVSYQIKEAGLKLEISELPPCFGDKDQINQLFSNILGNALKYLDPNRSGVIRVSGYKDNNHSVYCVEDNGIGISPDKHEKIFEIFHQIEPSKEKGQGLGLATVLRIINRHNGDVWLKSDLGKGTRFFVSLPSKKC
jgi:signal transduction histidine kinase